MMDLIERLWIAHGELPGRQLLMRDAITEIQRLRDENANLDVACKIADRKNEALHDLLTAASGAHEFLSSNSFSNPAEATEADIHRERLEAAIKQAKARMKCP